MPPVACKLALYAVPTVPLATVVVVIVSVAGETVSVRACVSVTGVAAESRTCAEKLKVPAAVGVPEIAPVLVLTVSPPGSEPLETDQV